MPKGPKRLLAPLAAKRPAKIRIPSVKVDVKKLLTKLGEAVARSSLMAPAGVDPGTAFAVNVIGSADAFSVKTPVEEKVWHLIQSAFASATAQILSEWPDSVRYFQGDIESLISKIEINIDNDLEIDLKYLTNPRGLPVLRDFCNVFRDWILRLGGSKPDVLALAARLPSYFTMALHNQWRSHPSTYQPILEALSSPAQAAAQREVEWIRYNDYLEKLIESPVFGEAFALKSIYISLRATYKESYQLNAWQSPQGVYSIREIAILLDSEIERWIGTSTINDSVRIVRGGPGCGKSTFLKMLAARLSTNPNHRVLLFPLQRFSLTEQLQNAIASYLRNTGAFEQSPLVGDVLSPSDGRLVLLFDGLDELTKPGETAEVEARRFLAELRTTLAQLNMARCRVVAVVTGRDAIIQASRDALRLPATAELRILPLRIDPTIRVRVHDPDGLTQIDLRKEWWKKYTRVKLNKESSFPESLDRDDLEEITAEPLLLYLLILSGFHEKEEIIRDFNRNVIYYNMLTEILKRPYEGRDGGRPYVQNEDIDEILEEIATAAWYGDGRTASLADVRSRCSSRLRSALDRLIKEGGGMHRLIAAFYFQRAEDRRLEDKEAFEFTHKSFGEYLTARRIVREIRSIYNALTQNRDFFTIRDALVKWHDLCGAMPMSRELARFVNDELRYGDTLRQLADWKKVLIPTPVA